MASQHFEYKVITVNSVRLMSQGIEADVEKELNELGKDGWELVGMEGNPQSHGVMFCLKRPA